MSPKPSIGVPVRLIMLMICSVIGARIGAARSRRRSSRPACVGREVHDRRCLRRHRATGRVSGPVDVGFGGSCRHSSGSGHPNRCAHRVCCGPSAVRASTPPAAPPLGPTGIAAPAVATRASTRRRWRRRQLPTIVSSLRGSCSPRSLLIRRPRVVNHPDCEYVTCLNRGRLPQATLRIKPQSRIDHTGHEARDHRP